MLRMLTRSPPHRITESQICAIWILFQLAISLLPQSCMRIEHSLPAEKNKIFLIQSRVKSIRIGLLKLWLKHCKHILPYHRLGATSRNEWNRNKYKYLSGFIKTKHWAALTQNYAVCNEHEWRASEKCVPCRTRESLNIPRMRAASTIQSELCQAFAVLWVHVRDSMLLATAAAYIKCSSVCPGQSHSAVVCVAVIAVNVNYIKL